MQIALIPPRSGLIYAAREQYHLILAHHVLADPEYANFYQNLSRRGDYIILDNSAHELGYGLPILDLLTAASRVCASEIVLPDRLFFGDDTVKLAQEALREIEKFLPQERPYITDCFMAVPQGRTPDEWEDCLYRLLELEYVRTIGISKDYEVWPGGLNYLVNRVPRDIQIHMLGLGREPWQLPDIARAYTNVRGVDSAKPFVYAMNGIELPENPIDFPPYPRRSSSYLADCISPAHARLVEHNIEVFRRIASPKPHVQETLAI